MKSDLFNRSSGHSMLLCVAATMAALLIAPILLSGCASLSGAQLHPPQMPPAAPPESEPPSPVPVPVTKHPDKSPWFTVLLYLPNRILDAGDVVRIGANIGPGFGIDLQATQAGQLSYITNTSVGVGFETFRQIPVSVRTQSKAAIGPAVAQSSLFTGFQNRFWDIGAEVYLFVAGVHAYVNPEEILDLLGGFFLIDPKHDDVTISY